MTIVHKSSKCGKVDFKDGQEQEEQEQEYESEEEQEYEEEEIEERRDP